MSMKMKLLEFAGKVEFLATGDHYISLGHHAPRATASTPGKTIVVNDRRILRAGICWEVDGVPVGLVADNYDLTDGDAQIACVVHGVVNRDKLPVPLTASQEAALPLIYFVEGERPSDDSNAFFLVQVAHDSNATVVPEEGSRRVVKKGGSYAFKVEPAASHTVSKVEANGDELQADSDGVYTIDNISEDVDVVLTIA